MRFSTFATLFLSSVAVLAADINVSVGSGGNLVYGPNSITANQGDNVHFQFSGPHTVTMSSFDNPCTPAPGGFNSGTGSSGQTFTVTVNNTDPVWVSCQIPGHCQAGMVFAINAPTSGTNTFANFQAKAEGRAVSSPTSTGASSSASPSGSASSSTASSSSPSLPNNPYGSGGASPRFVGSSMILGGFVLAVVGVTLGAASL